jgi:polyamine oxidase
MQNNFKYEILSILNHTFFLIPETPFNLLRNLQPILLVSTMWSPKFLSSLTVLSALLYPAIADDSRVINTTVLILGGGLTGITAARALALENNVTDFLVVEARHELGGRVQNGEIGGLKVEFGANWIQGLGSNPIWKLAQKYGIQNTFSNWSNIDYFLADGYDSAGIIEAVLDNFEDTIFPLATENAAIREQNGRADLNMKAALGLSGWKASTPAERAAEYFVFDWEYAEPPIMSSYLESINSENYNSLGFGNGDNNLVIDQRGFKELILGQAREIPGFEKRVLYNEIVRTIKYSDSGVTVTTKGGYTINAEYALCTFSSVSPPRITLSILTRIQYWCPPA